MAVGKPGTPTSLVAVGGTTAATLTLEPAAGAAFYEAAILKADGTATTFAYVATCKAGQTSGCSALSDVPSSTQKTFSTPLAAFANVDNKYRFKLRAVDSNGVAGDWSNPTENAVTVGE